jgi:hypothetical protein
MFRSRIRPDVEHKKEVCRVFRSAVAKEFGDEWIVLIGGKIVGIGYSEPEAWADAYRLMDAVEVAA